MVDRIKYLAVPMGYHSTGAWKGIIKTFPDGYKLHYYSCCLSELAVQIGAGGAIIYDSGEPMPPEIISAVIDCDHGFLINYLFPTLEKIGEGVWGSEGEWVCRSKMAQHTIGWQADRRKKLLPPPEKKELERKKPGRKSIFSGIEPGEASYEAVYRQWKRTCRLPAGISLAGPCQRLKNGDKTCLIISVKVKVCPNLCPELSENDTGNVRKRPELSENDLRTNQLEDAEIIEEVECPEMHKQKEVKKTLKAAARKSGAAASIENLPNKHQTLLRSFGSAAHRSLLIELASAQLLDSVSEEEIFETIKDIKHRANEAKNFGKWARSLFSNRRGREILEVAALKKAEKQGKESRQEEAARKAAQGNEEKQQKLKRNLIAVQKQILAVENTDAMAQIKREIEEKVRSWGGTKANIKSAIEDYFAAQMGLVIR